jgi:hypothetical protein
MLRSIKRGRINCQNNWTYWIHSNIIAAVEDPLAIAKLSFFSPFSLMFEPFLKKYQTAEQMMAFLHDDLNDLISSLMGCFVKESVQKASDTTYKLMEIDLSS